MIIIQVYEAVNYFNRSRYVVIAKDEEELISILDEQFQKDLKKITDDKGQYDDLRESKKQRIKEIGFKLLVNDATKSGITERPFKGDDYKFFLL